MKKNIISCMAIMVAALASACGDYQVNHECEIGDVKSENDSVIYRCVGIKDKYSYWEKEICQYGILEDKEGKKMCKECDPDNENANICEIKAAEARFSVCNNGIWKSSLCVSGECSADGRKCGCSKCVKGCEGNDDGACIKVEGCKQNDPVTGACICINGNNADGTCKCDCVAGCESDGSCKLVEGCNQHDRNGACICAHGTKNDGTCDDSFCVKGTFNSKDGSCTCPSDCSAGCFEDGLCKLIGNCSNDANCNEYGYCSGNLCYCKEGKCLLNDINGNHIHDRYESNLVNEHCNSDKNCNVAGGEFCDSAMGYKCSVKCSEKTCVDGFVCRSDGRCASEYFTTVWDEKIRNGKESLLFHVSGCKSEIEVCWDWKDDEVCEWDKITECSKDWKHTYESGDGDVTIKIKGELDGVNFYRDCVVGANEGCEINESICCMLLEVQSFGLTGFSTWHDGNKNWKGEKNNVDRGVFEQCYMLRKISDVDIPNPKKLNTMSRMFLDACSFNSPIEQWDVSNVTDMWKLLSMPNCIADAVAGQGQSCFNMYPVFNQPINRWNVSNVINMNNTFQSLPSFNQPLNDWDVSKVTDMGGMFAHAVAFNYPLDKWKVERVTNMRSMFYRALSFDQDLSKWNPKSIDVTKYDDTNGAYYAFFDTAMANAYSNDRQLNGNLCKIYNSSNWHDVYMATLLFYYNSKYDNPIVECGNP